MIGEMSKWYSREITDNWLRLGGRPISGEAQHPADEIDVEILAPDRLDRRTDAGRAVRIDINPPRKRIV